MNRESALRRFKQLYDEYGPSELPGKGIRNNADEAKKPVVPDKHKSAINDLLDMVIFMDQQAKNIVVLADMAVAEAREIESAVMRTEEGVILVEHLKRFKPELFPLYNKRTFEYGHA
jgi:hypothetical protein